LRSHLSLLGGGACSFRLSLGASRFLGSGLSVRSCTFRGHAALRFLIGSGPGILLAAFSVAALGVCLLELQVRSGSRGSVAVGSCLSVEASAVGVIALVNGVARRDFGRASAL
jgi:hypothetical protein